MSLGIAINMADVTVRYVDVRLDRKFVVLEAYHNAMVPNKAKKIAQRTVQ